MKAKKVIPCNIAILGFASNVSLTNKIIAFLTGFILAIKGCNILAGNITGTFRYAFVGAKLFRGKTFAILDAPCSKSCLLADTIIIRPIKKDKHKQIALYSSAAIIIGGGENSKNLIKELIKANKPVIAVRNTHGIVDGEIKAYNIRTLSLLSAITWLLANVIK